MWLLNGQRISAEATVVSGRIPSMRTVRSVSGTVASSGCRPRSILFDRRASAEAVGSSVPGHGFASQDDR
jgi:hypothetical protein